MRPLHNPTLSGLLYFVSCPSNKRKLRIMHNTLYLLLTLMFLSEIIELYRIRSDLTAAIKNLSLTILTYTINVKIGTFFMWQKDWMSVTNFVSSMEKYQHNQGDSDIKDIIYKYRNYSRRVTYYYWSLVTASVIVFTFGNLLSYFIALHLSKTINVEEHPYPEIISAWLPFDTTKGYKYWTFIIFKFLIKYYSAAAFALYDSNVFVLMTFFVGQLDILKLNSERLFKSEEVTISYKKIIKNIRECHHHHILLVRNFKLFNSLLSPVMFIYIVFCSIMMCCSAVQLTLKEATIMEKAFVTEYIVAQIFQLFLFCWHSQIVFDKSLKLDEGVYSSAWWSQKPYINSNIILLAGQLKKTFVFTAGPFVNLNLATCIAILKGAYSYYTLMSNVGK